MMLLMVVTAKLVLTAELVLAASSTSTATV